MRVVVVGGGVAGSASAVALARIGAHVTVYEAYDDPAGPVGSFVSLSVNGLRGLEALGCLEAVQRAGFPVERQRMWSGRDRLLGDVPRGRRGGDPLHSVTLMRADLVRALREEATRAGARIAVGTRLGPAPSGPLTAGADPYGALKAGADPYGPLTAGADLVVGADGIWSATRQTIDPTAPWPSYAGLYSISGVTDRPVHLPGDRPQGFNMVFARRGAFIYLPAPDGTVWWSAQVAAADPPADPAAVTLGELAGLFATEQTPHAVIRASSAVTAATLLHVLPPVTRRHDGRRTVLVGDAAHPVGAGQGASMAVEDAIALARELSATADIPAALAAFDRIRHDRTGKLARSAAANRDAKTAGPVAARLREIMMPFFFNRFYEKGTGWLYDHDPGQLPAGRPY
ncbi:FAD-dependent oxidoreductase [Nonomuraea phyllanthi]|uniref:FAD-dependent oxidoreductase n=1 Tax=Nonomuraea phyllanthi TaxID=2219224 RepID=UPI00129317AB|nr:NAD(P)/FAD-dependent oxidoreductase [Nonomuraea phyllanthi]QFY05828.1 FAD-dependent oxidoreductase [Nonomuraea phyllanthi]